MIHAEDLKLNEDRAQIAGTKSRDASFGFAYSLFF